eukprot:Rhum_TRINITY_DN9144_c0_g1::Rhum_TRINITY_DN9144_c0_g1_i1::g.31740::m.31740
MPSAAARDVIPFSLDAPRHSIFPAKESHRTLRAGVRRFVEEHVAPHIDEWEEQGVVPRQLHVTAAQDPSGFYALRIPPKYGGSSTVPDLDPLHSLIINEELARTGSLGFGAALMTWGIGLPPIIAHGSEELNRRVTPGVASGEKLIALCITEPWGGSDVASIKCTGVDMGDHYVVNGTKSFITTGMRADYLTVAVKTGKSALSGTTLMVIESCWPGVKRTAMKKMGWLCSDTAIINFENVRVPKANVIGQPGKGFLYVMRNFNGERLTMASQCVAASRVCLEDAIRYGRQRKTFGKPLVQNQGIRWKLMEVAKEVEACQSFLDIMTAAGQAAQEGSDADADPLLVAKYSLLKLKCTRTFEMAAREACQVFGGKSFIRGGPAARVERLYREVRVMAIGGGSEEIMMELASRQAKL